MIVAYRIQELTRRMHAATVASALVAKSAGPDTEVPAPIDQAHAELLVQRLEAAGFEVRLTQRAA